VFGNRQRSEAAASGDSDEFLRGEHRVPQVGVVVQDRFDGVPIRHREDSGAEAAAR